MLCSAPARVYIWKCIACAKNPLHATARETVLCHGRKRVRQWWLQCIHIALLLNEHLKWHIPRGSPLCFDLCKLVTWLILTPYLKVWGIPRDVKRPLTPPTEQHYVVVNYTVGGKNTAAIVCPIGHASPHISLFVNRNAAMWTGVVKKHLSRSISVAACITIHSLLLTKMLHCALSVLRNTCHIVCIHIQLSV